MVNRPNPVPNDEVAAYFERKGAVALLCEIDVSGSQFSRLAEALAISRTTLTRRLEEGVELGLLEKVDFEGRGTSHAYALTEPGARLRMFLNQTGATEKHRQVKRLRREFDEQAAQFRSWVAADDELVAPAGDEGFRERLRTIAGDE